MPKCIFHCNFENWTCKKKKHSGQNITKLLPLTATAQKHLNTWSCPTPTYTLESQWKGKNDNEWQRLTLFYQDMFIYSGKWQESQVFHRYVQRDINSSHLLHKAHSAGTVQGTQGAWGQRGHILYTELKHTCFTPYRKRTEAWWRRQKGREDERRERRG